jgi:transposase InsO family protein
MGSFDNRIAAKVDGYRPEKTGWGPITIKVELGRERVLKGLARPSRSTIAAYLKSQGKTRTRQKRIPLPTSPCYPPEFPHDLWQMDAEGNKQVKGLGTVCMINLKDSFSKTYVNSLPLVFANPCSHPEKSNYQTLLRLAFLEFGMNRRLQVDHESIYYDNKSASPFPTSFHLWLTGLGIELCYTPKGQPQKQGMVERAHQTMHLQVTAGQSFDCYRQLMDRCQERRERLNHEIPSRSTQDMPPLVANPKAVKSGKPYSVERENQMFDPKRIQDLLAQGRWFRRISTNKKVNLGGHVYHLPKASPNTEVEIRFNRYRSTFIFFDANRKLINTKPALGLAFEDLAGDLEAFQKFVQENIAPRIIEVV